ncbi:MAG: hypothetical protein ABIF09_18640 [Gemmatimonadota bacterium]
MRAFTYSFPDVEEGIILSDKGKIVLGEKGRGRHQVIVTPTAGSLVKGNRLMSVPGPETSALVLFPDQSGFRGGWRLTQPINCCTTARPWEEFPPGWNEARYELAKEMRPARPHRLEVVAEGYAAQGAAGRMGGGHVILAVMANGQEVEVVRGGRLYGEPGVIRVTCSAGYIEVLDSWAHVQEQQAAKKFADLQGGS